MLSNIPSMKTQNKICMPKDLVIHLRLANERRDKQTQIIVTFNSNYLFRCLKIIKTV